MSIFKLNPLDYQTITVATNPSRYYSSSSAGVTGSIFVFPRRSEIEKEVSTEIIDFRSYDDATFLETYNQIKSNIKKSISGTYSSNQEPILSKYLQAVGEQNVSTKKYAKLDIKRFVPTPISGSLKEVTNDNKNYLSENYLKKSIIKSILTPHYRARYPSSNWGYCNYHSLNFFTSSTVSSESALFYPNYDDGKVIHEGYVSGTYTPSGSFSFDFYINPRYKNLDDKGHFRAGTIFHLWNTYALSLVTGSKKDENNLPIGFRLMLQLSHSAGIAPSSAIIGNYPNDLTFFSDDNSLSWNNWHHVVVRWGTNLINNGTGSFNIDGVDKGIFVVPSGTIAPKIFTSANNPDALCIGNFFGSANLGIYSHKRFFTSFSRECFGLYAIDESDTTNANPSIVSSHLTHPLQAEVHDLTIKRYYVSNKDIELSGSTGPDNLDEGISFYLPPFFVEQTPIRKRELSQNTSGTPFTIREHANGTTMDPFNVNLAFGSNGHLINTENFLKDFATNNLPRQWQLEPQAQGPIFSIPDLDASSILYRQQGIRKRNLTILPCDDGNFYPNYEILNNEPQKSKYVDDLNSYAPGLINLSNLLEENRSHINNDPSDSNLTTSLQVTPESPLASLNVPSRILYQYASLIRNFDFANKTIYDLQKLQREIPWADIIRSKDSSSNQMVIFDISNLYYGMNILPGSFTISDQSITGSGGAVSITLKDDGLGGLYRANSITPHSTWNSVGTIFYDEGLVVIKSPHLYFLGKDGYEMSFKGEQNIHVGRLDVVAPANFLNSSSNPSFVETPTTLNANEYDSKFVYITGINFHDDNLNVVMKTQLAQPIVKRHSDKIAFKVKYDW